MPRDLSYELIAEIEAAVVKGEWPKEAAKRLGTSARRFNLWMAKGTEFFDDPDWSALEPQDRLCVELAGRVWIAEATHENEMRLLWQQSLADGKAGLWQGYSNLLQLRYADRWRKREMVKGEAAKLSPEEEFRQLAEAEKKVREAK